MQKLNFPNMLYRVTLWPGKGDATAPEATVTRVPARFSEKTAATISGRRIDFKKLGKIECIADSWQTHIIRSWVRDEESIPDVVRAMHELMRKTLLQRQDYLQKQIDRSVDGPTIRTEDYRD